MVETEWGEEERDVSAIASIGEERIRVPCWKISLRGIREAQVQKHKIKQIASVRSQCHASDDVTEFEAE